MLTLARVPAAPFAANCLGERRSWPSGRLRTRVLPELSKFRFQVEYRTNDFNTQVGLEQMLYDRYPEAQTANGGFNIRAPVAETNRMYDTYMRAAQDYSAALEGG